MRLNSLHTLWIEVLILHINLTTMVKLYDLKHVLLYAVNPKVPNSGKGIRRFSSRDSPPNSPCFSYHPGSRMRQTWYGYGIPQWHLRRWRRSLHQTFERTVYKIKQSTMQTLPLSSSLARRVISLSRFYQLSSTKNRPLRIRQPRDEMHITCRCRWY